MITSVVQAIWRRTFLTSAVLLVNQQFFSQVSFDNMNEKTPLLSVFPALFSDNSGLPVKIGRDGIISE